MEKQSINEKSQGFEKFIEKIKGFKLNRRELKAGLERGEIEIIKNDLGLSNYEINFYYNQLMSNKGIRL